ncbi:MAG: hypothetical protein ACPGJF_05575 [Sinimarinibacterium flocculans]|uniref:hypothetical protein n=1 Tax=Sinimarinibacterium flocculans TaxID=985250 RepID=UPI003C51F263
MRSVLVVLAYVGTAHAQTSTHAPCSDPGPFETLKAMVESHEGDPGQPDIKYLLALRHFVCDQLEVGNLLMPEATRLYDEEKHRIIKKWKMNPKELTF